MKQTVLMLLFAGACFSSLSAQMSVGMRLGSFSSSYWTYEGGDGGNQLLTRAHFGAVGMYAINDHFHVRAELNYAPKGDRWYFETKEGGRAEFKDVFNYLEIPVMAQFGFGTGEVLPYVIGGVYAARAMSNKYTKDNKTYDFDEFTRGDFGVVLGAGAGMPLGPGTLFAEWRFSQGLKDMDAFQDGTQTRMRGFGFTAGWVFDLN